MAPGSIQALKPKRVRYVAIAQEEPHPNPPLAKGRGPEVQLIKRQITMSVKNLLL
ncbi:hypothetical protein NG799_05410 [Laspinema sp. D1]|uniref:Uncharacterized protein n=1 Tax=Laspinema palackyanum D2a TaxID=2953684 RepID=A0ABT2MM00_9CYAN|nr:hypothetical protein [Laspinema sp. D2a]